MKNIMKEIKQHKKMMYAHPEFFKEFLEQLMMTPTFKNKIVKRLQTIEETQTSRVYKYVKKHPLVLLDMRYTGEYGSKRDVLPGDYLKRRRPIQIQYCEFGLTGREAGDQYLTIQLDFKNMTARLREGMFSNSSSTKAVTHFRPVAQHSRELIEKFFNDYRVWVRLD